MLIGTPQAVSIAVEAGLTTIVNYRILLAMIAAAFAACALWLLARPQQRPVFFEAAAATTAEAAGVSG